jgi:hypothetical protein
MATATEDLTEHPPDEPITPPAPAQPVVPDQAQQHAELERAVADLPAIPGRDEFLTLCQLARVYSASSIVPRALRDKPNDVLVVLMTGRDLGIPATAALRKVYVIDGQPSIAPQLKLSLVRKKRLGQVIPHPDNDSQVDRQGAVALGPGGQMLTDDKGAVIGWTGGLGPPYWYTWDDAITAGLVRRGCSPGSHTDECEKARKSDNIKQTNGLGMANFCKDNWRKNPRRMLWQRASGFCADDYFAEATLGLYDPDELGAILDDDGQLLDVNHVELPDGMGPRRTGGNGGSGGSGDDETPVDPETAWGLQVRVFAMPEDAQAEFRERWVKSKKVPGGFAYRYGDDGVVRQRPFPAAKLALVESMLRGVEHDWKAQGKYDPVAGPAAFAENVVGPSLLHWLTRPFGGISFRGYAAQTPPLEAQDAPSGPEPEAAADSAPAPADAGDAAEGQPEGQPDGALPLGLPAGPPPDLLTVPEEVKAGTDDEQVAWLVGYLKNLRVADVDTLLRYYEAPTSGVPSERRQRLGALIAQHELGKEPPAGAEG